MEKQKNKADLYQIILPEEQYFTYTIEPYVFTNSLGAQVAVLQEYSIQNKEGEIFKLYKTTEGNWHDISAEISIEINSTMRLLKNAIERKEKAGG